MNNTSNAQEGQGFYIERRWFTVKQASAYLTERGMPMSIRVLLNHINAGGIQAKRDTLRPTQWVISLIELTRILNQGS